METSLYSILSLFKYISSSPKTSFPPELKKQYLQDASMEISDAQSNIDHSSCVNLANEFLTCFNSNFASKPDDLLNNSILLIQRIFSTSHKPFPQKQLYIVVDDYCFLEFFLALLSLSTFFENKEHISTSHQYPVDYIFEIFPSSEFDKPPKESAMNQLGALVEILKNEKSNRKLPIILVNSAILDMIPDYLHQFASCSKEDLRCNALISVNGCNYQFSISREKLLIFIAHKDHFNGRQDPISASFKDCLHLIPISIQEVIKTIFQDYSDGIHETLQELAENPNEFSLPYLIKPFIHPLLLMKKILNSKKSLNQDLVYAQLSEQFHQCIERSIQTINHNSPFLPK